MHGKSNVQITKTMAIQIWPGNDEAKKQGLQFICSADTIADQILKIIARYWHPGSCQTTVACAILLTRFSDWEEKRFHPGQI